MYRALYPFKKTHPTSLSFKQGDNFLELSGASNDKNWYYVIGNDGQAGYIPKNYVILEQISNPTLISHIEILRDKLRMRKASDKEKSELLSNLEGIRNKLKREESTSNGLNADSLSNNISAPNVSSSGSSPVIPRPFSVSPKSSNSDRSATSPTPGSSKSLKKRAAPKPPQGEKEPAPDPITKGDKSSNSSSPSGKNPAIPPKMGANKTNNRKPECCLCMEHYHLQLTNPSSSQQQPSPPPPQHIRKSSVTDPTAEQIKRHAVDLVELVRVETGLSHSNSQSVVQSVLQYVSTNLHRLDRNIPAILTELEFPVLSELSDIAVSSDTLAMERLFEQLTQCKEDDQQRNWMLYEDEANISGLLQHLSDCLTNSDKQVSRYVLSKFKYFYVHNLVEYFQMETRWSLRKLLIENFMMMCSLDPVIISMFLSSVLPLELAQDMFQNLENIQRLRACTLLLTIIFSRGEPMPVHYFEQLGANFVNFLLDNIEDPPKNDCDLDIPDVFVGLALSYNLQFFDIKTNVLIASLASRPSAKSWTEKILLLLNREEDPCILFLTDISPEQEQKRKAIAHSVQKAIIDMFTHPTCHKLFYTNDIYVLIDIIVRQLADLGPENPSRNIYVRLCRLVLQNTDYTEHLHRFKDLEMIFIRILDDDEESHEDKKFIEEICKEIPAFHTLAP